MELTSSELREIDVRVSELLGYTKRTGFTAWENCYAWLPPGDMRGRPFEDGGTPLDIARTLVPRFTTDPAAGETLLAHLTSFDCVQVDTSSLRLGGIITHLVTVSGQGFGPVKRRGHTHSQPTRLIALALAAVAACEGRE